MATATVGALKVVLSADSAQFSQGMKEAEGIAARFGTAIGKITGVVAAFGAAATAAAAVVAVNMQKIANEADEMGKAAQKVGLMATELSALKYTADLAGVGFESLQTSLVRLTRSMSDVAKGSESDAAKAFQVLGIAVSNADGSLRSASEVMGDVAQKFSEFKDGAEKTALAVAIFGRAGADMIPLLNQGRDAIAASNEEAKQFGVTMSGDLTRASEQLNDNLSRVGSAMHGIYVQIAERVVPKLAELSDQFVGLIKELNLAESAGQLAEKALGGLAYYAALAKGNFEGLTTSIVGWREAASLAFSGDLGGALTKLGALKDALDQVEKKMLSSMQRISLANAGMLSGAAPILSSSGFSGGSSVKPNAPTIASAVSGGGGASTPESEYNAEKARIEARLQAIREGYTAEEQLKLEKYEADQNLIDEAFQKKMITEQQHNEMLLGLEKQFQDDKARIRAAADNKALSDAASFFGSAAKITESWGKKNNAVSKALGIAQALISTYVGATKAMETMSTFGPAAGLAAFAAVLGKGLAAVAAITAVNPNGSSGAGRSVGGGAGGGVAQQAAPDQAQRSMYVTLNGSTFNREQMRDFFEQANSFYKDGGGQIVFAR